MIKLLGMLHRGTKALFRTLIVVIIKSTYIASYFHMTDRCTHFNEAESFSLKGWKAFHKLALVSLSCITFK